MVDFVLDDTGIVVVESVALVIATIIFVAYIYTGESFNISKSSRIR